MKSHINGAWIGEEIEGLNLPDKRFRKNIISITEHLADNVGKSFSAACGAALRKSAWRLFSYEDLSLLSTHQQKTLQRCAGHDVILVVEDTTDLAYFQKQKQGMGPLGGPKRMNVKGLNMHTALAMGTDGAALGIVHQKIWAPCAGRIKIELPHLPIEQKESFKWIEALRSVNNHWKAEETSGEQRLGAQTVVMIADREADFFEHYAQPRSAGVELLVRVSEQKRNIIHDNSSLKIKELVGQLKPAGTGMVRVWRRADEKERLAKVNYSFTTLTIPPTYKQTLPAQTMNLVYIKEEDRTGKDAIEWILLTSLQVNTLEDALTVATYYSRRWVVERFHLILKSGLRVEKLQLDNFTRLSNALQLYALIGWHLLLLYRLGRSVPDQDALEYFSSEAVEVLSAVTGAQIVTVEHFIVGIGKLGGFIPTKKQALPGEKTLWIGLRQFVAITNGFIAAKQKYGTG